MKLFLSDIFKNETMDFTPWLISTSIVQDIIREQSYQNIEFWKKECKIGDYRMDAVYRGVDGNSNVIVENQFGLSDSKHLGQIITYAHLTGIRTILWIADSISCEHREISEVLSDINIIPCSVNVEHTGERYLFYFTVFPEHHVFRFVFDKNLNPIQEDSNRCTTLPEIPMETSQESSILS